MLSICVTPTEGKTVSSSDHGDWVLLCLFILWAVFVIVVWEGVRYLKRAFQLWRRRRDVGFADPEQEPAPEFEDIDPLPALDAISPRGPRVRIEEAIDPPRFEPEVGPQRVRVQDYDEVRRAAVERNQGLRRRFPEIGPQEVQAPPIPREPEAAEVYGRLAEAARPPRGPGRVGAGRLDEPPNPPLRFKTWWEVPEQLTIRELQWWRSAWGGEISALRQVPAEDFDTYKYPGTGRWRFLFGGMGLTGCVCSLPKTRASRSPSIL